MPVLPDVPSIIVPPGLSSPAFSASSIIFTAMRSLIELPGLNVSTLATTVAGTSFAMRLMRTIGVWPMAARMFEAILDIVASALRADATTILVLEIQSALHTCAQRGDGRRLADEQVVGELAVAENLRVD